MSQSGDRERFSNDFQEVEDVLRERRPELEPVELDRIKLRAMSSARRSTSSREEGFFMRSRLATILAVGFLTLGTGGALAVAGGGNGGHNNGGNASFHQYRPPCERGRGHHGDRDCHGKHGKHGKHDKGDRHHKGGKGGYNGNGNGGQGAIVGGGLVGQGGKGGNRGH